MKKDEHYEKTRFFHAVEKDWGQLKNKYGYDCSEACMQSMKRIHKELRNAIYQGEVLSIERKKQQGKITPKEAVHQKSLCRKKYC